MIVFRIKFYSIWMLFNVLYYFSDFDVYWFIWTLFWFIAFSFFSFFMFCTFVASKKSKFWEIVIRFKVPLRYKKFPRLSLARDWNWSGISYIASILRESGIDKCSSGIISLDFICKKKDQYDKSVLGFNSIINPCCKNLIGAVQYDKFTKR